MAVIVRFECDRVGCESYVATDVLHREGPEHLFDASAKRDGADGLVGLEVELRLEGWFCGDAGMGNDLRVLCPRHGAVCPRCRGAGFVGDAPCDRCGTFGVIEVDEATAATLAWLTGGGRPTDYEEQVRALGFPTPSYLEPPEEARVAAGIVPTLAAVGVKVEPCPHADYGAVYGCCPMLVHGLPAEGAVEVCPRCPEREAMLAMVRDQGRKLAVGGTLPAGSVEPAPPDSGPGEGSAA